MSVIIGDRTLSHGEAAHLAWLLASGNTQTPWLSEIIHAINGQVPTMHRLIKT